MMHPLFYYKTTMKYFAVLFILVSFLLSCNNKRKNDTHLKANSIEFIDSIHNFGIIPIEKPIDSIDFKFVNKGNDLLVILNAKPSCHCTRVKYPKYPINPGDTSYVRVIYDGTGRSPEFFNKSVSVYTNAAFESIRLYINGQLQ